MRYKMLRPRAEIGNSFLLLRPPIRCGEIKRYYEFSAQRTRQIPFVGTEGIVCLTEWLISIRSRFRAVHRKGRYFLKVPGEAMGINSPIAQPGAIAATRAPGIKSAKHSPSAPTEFIKVLEDGASNSDLVWCLRVLCSMICLMTYASLRYAGAVSTFHIWKPDSAICGESTDAKNKDGDIMEWATPIRAISGN